MDPIIEMLRDENNAIEQLTARREELKRKLEEHRSGNISAEEFEKLSAERKDIEKELALRTKRRDELTAAADKNKNQGEGRGIMNDNLLHFKDGMESADIPATAEYRSAFFKRLQRTAGGSRKARDDVGIDVGRSCDPHADDGYDHRAAP